MHTRTIAGHLMGQSNSIFHPNPIPTSATYLIIAAYVIYTLCSIAELAHFWFAQSLYARARQSAYTAA